MRLAPEGPDDPTVHKRFELFPGQGTVPLGPIHCPPFRVAPGNTHCKGVGLILVSQKYDPLV